MGCPIRKSPDQSSFAAPQRLIAADRVLHRLLAPRHSPYALSSLTIGLELMPAGLIMTTSPHQSLSLTLTTTLLCLWIGKTTVCRIFSCQRSPEELRPSDSLTRSLAGTPCAPLRSRGAHSRALNLAEATHARHRAPRTRNSFPSPALAVACQPELRAQRAISEGWWRIPASNR